MLGSKLQRIHTLVGEATSLWNQVEEMWYLVFTALMASSPREVVDAIYGQFQTGAAQRQLILSVSTASLKTNPAKLKAREPLEHFRRRLLRKIGQLNAKTNDLAGKRNAVIHSSFEIWGAAIPPRIIAISPHKKSRVADENHEVFLTHLNQDVSLLLLDMYELRDLSIDLIEGLGNRKTYYEFLRRKGLPAPIDEWQAARDQILRAVRERTLPPSS